MKRLPEIPLTLSGGSPDASTLVRAFPVATNPRGQEEAGVNNVFGPQVVAAAEVLEIPPPAEIQEALGELVGVGAARTGLLALSLGLGPVTSGSYRSQAISTLRTSV